MDVPAAMFVIGFVCGLPFAAVPVFVAWQREVAPLQSRAANLARYIRTQQQPARAQHPSNVVPLRDHLDEVTEDFDVRWLR